MELIEKLESMNRQYKEMPSLMIEEIAKLLQKYDVTTLSFYNDPDEWPGIPKYTDEDKKLFESLDLDKDMMVGWTNERIDYSNGPVIAIKCNKENSSDLHLFLADDYLKNVYENSIEEYKDYGIDLDKLVDAILFALRFNLENDIPREKWGINHYPDVDPYTFKYLGKEDEEDDDDDNDDDAIEINVLEVAKNKNFRDEIYNVISNYYNKEHFTIALYAISWARDLTLYCEKQFEDEDGVVFDQLNEIMVKYFGDTVSFDTVNDLDFIVEDRKLLTPVTDNISIYDNDVEIVVISY